MTVLVNVVVVIQVVLVIQQKSSPFLLRIVLVVMVALADYILHHIPLSWQVMLLCLVIV